MNTLNLATVRTNLTAIASFQTVIGPIETTLDTIQFDRRKINDPQWQVIAFLDFRDLYRYLHPLLDYSAYQSPDVFTAEQVALEYLFRDKPLDLYLLNEYLEEYRLTLRGIHMQMVDLAMTSDEDIEKRVIRLDDRLSQYLDKMRAATKAQKVEGARELLRHDEVLLDYLFDDVRPSIMKSGLSRFHKLMSQNVIRDASDVGGIKLEDLNPAVDSAYEDLCKRLQRFRPGRKRSNETDARAFWLTHKLNQQYFPLKKLFLLVTSSDRVIDAFQSDEAIDCFENRDLHEMMDEVSVLRTPSYFLLHMFLKSDEFTNMELDFDGFTDLVSRYSKVASKLEGYFEKEVSPVDVRDQDFAANYREAVQLRQQLEPYIDALGKFGKSLSRPESLYKTVAARLKLPSILDEKSMRISKLRDKIASAIEDPKVIITHFSATAKRLNKSISELEQRLVPLMYRTKGYELIYPVHTQKSTDKRVRRIADEIVQLLSHRSQESFAEAFRKLGDLRKDFPRLPDTCVLASKVHRAVRAYRDSLQYATRAVEAAPDYLEAHFELALCYRKIAESESNYSLLTKSWDHCLKAKCIGESDARVQRELNYLTWLAVEGKWTLPVAVDDLNEHLISCSRKALECSKKTPDGNDRITLSIMNDLAYYLALTGEEESLKESLDLSNQALENADSLDAASRAAFQDTKGFTLMQLYRITDPNLRDHKMLEEAALLIRQAYRMEKTRSTRLQHYEEVMDLVLESRLG